ncbi:MAG: C4-dicarboxylate ABC transporter [Bacteroidetes bacterium]|nr:C4-dicarboxylate ABC transporter [Bacteroidota bacterium]
MFSFTEIVLGIMVLVYIVSKVFRVSTELSMFFSAVAGSLAGGFGLQPRYFAEGAITYLDINLIFITATFFMNILKESGGVAFAVREILSRFHNHRILILVLMTIILLVPGALTGAGSVTVLIAGGMVSVVLNHMGITKLKTAAIIFIVAGLSAAAPPVSLWAMMTAAGVNMPYIGFFLPLLIPCVLGALITMFLLGWKGEKSNIEEAFEELPIPPERMSWILIALPFLVFFGLIAMGRFLPYSSPIVGLPLMFLIAGATSYFVSPTKIKILQVSRDTIKQLLPLIGTLTAVGILVEIMTLTGVRGLLAVTTVTLPVSVVFGILFFVLPLSEAVLMWGAAPVIGVPLVLLFNTIGLNPIIALAGMSMIWPLGDALPPTALIGRLTVDVVGVDESYSAFLRTCILPSIIIMVMGTLMVIFSSQLDFLTAF